ncbi:MAG: peptidylprolyl isomerase [Cytophagaceae bacterium]|jgi:cyclophilin family peptidyl-prolyl cis-trans isomerase|nr:peptidylprolyl isomerase [Cytophagaceae bacterium]
MFKPVTFFLLTLGIVTAGCVQKSSQQKVATQSKTVAKGSYKSNILGMVEIHTSDQYTRPITKGFGFYVDEETIVANLDLIQGAARVKIAPPGTQQLYDVTGYTACNFNHNLVLLKTVRRNKNYLKMYEPPTGVDTLYMLLRPHRDLFVSKCSMAGEFATDSATYFRLACALKAGNPVFYPDHSMAGIVQEQKNEHGKSQTVVLKAAHIINLMKQQHAAKPVLDLKGRSNKKYISYTKIEGFRVNTDAGTFVIRLYNQTPEYRDNFIQLVSDCYYDSLLIHRVLKNFLVQTGAADTKHALAGETVGWQGPGYTLPLKIVSGLYHKRGAVAASKLPDERNPHNRSDGAQFYVVSGRRFGAAELDEIEKTKNIRFTDEQRQVYATTGGAPHLDSDYTVFGEVVSGMDVIDRIAAVETDNSDRPVKDVRIKSIVIMEK